MHWDDFAQGFRQPLPSEEGSLPRIGCAHFDFCFVLLRMAFLRQIPTTTRCIALAATRLPIQARSPTICQRPRTAAGTSPLTVPVDLMISTDNDVLVQPAFLLTPIYLECNVLCYALVIISGTERFGLRWSRIVLWFLWLEDEKKISRACFSLHRFNPLLRYFFVTIKIITN
jgi:hypothetical protein